MIQHGVHLNVLMVTQQCIYYRGQLAVKDEHPHPGVIWSKNIFIFIKSNNAITYYFQTFNNCLFKFHTFMSVSILAVQKHTIKDKKIFQFKT